MLVTAMDINMTIINNNAGNGDGYNCDNVLKQYLVTAMDIIVTIINNNAGNGDGYKRDNKHFKYINIYYPKLYI